MSPTIGGSRVAGPSTLFRSLLFLSISGTAVALYATLGPPTAGLTSHGSTHLLSALALLERVEGEFERARVELQEAAGSPTI